MSLKKKRPLVRHTLEDIAKEARSMEYPLQLVDLGIFNNVNHAYLELKEQLPIGVIQIHAIDAAAPEGSTKICDGELLLSGQRKAVSAYRLVPESAAEEVEAEGEEAVEQDQLETDEEPVAEPDDEQPGD